MLVPDVENGAPKNQPAGPAPRRFDEQELIHRKIAGEKTWASLSFFGVSQSDQCIGR
jgi:hypothetical protein